MATWDDVRRLALALPETDERRSRDLLQWRVKDKLFVWERPLRGSDLEALGDRAPDGVLVRAAGVRVGDEQGGVHAGDSTVCPRPLRW